MCPVLKTMYAELLKVFSCVLLNASFLSTLQGNLIHIITIILRANEQTKLETNTARLQGKDFSIYIV